VQAPLPPAADRPAERPARQPRDKGEEGVRVERLRDRGRCAEVAPDRLRVGVAAEAIAKPFEAEAFLAAVVRVAARTP
jgi:hypothetical protein